MKRPRWATGYGGFLLSLCALLLTQPFVVHFHLSGALFEAVFTLTLVAGALGAAKTRTERLALWIMVAVAVPIRWGGFASDDNALVELGHFAAVAVFFYTAGLLLSDIVSKSEVTVDTLYGAAAVYLLVALCFSLVYQILARDIPGAFAVHGVPVTEAHTNAAGTFSYFSLVTLSTLGYGDIVPLNPIARTFAALEAVFGQLYVAMLIGRLLGMHIQEQRG